MLTGTVVFVGAVVILAGLQIWEKRTIYVVRFAEEVSGLEVSAPVKYQGLRIGRVEDMVIAAQKELLSMAVARQQAINADHPLVSEFWEIFDYLDGDDAVPQLNHARDDKLIAVNLNHFIMRAADKRQQVPPISELKRVLKTSRTRKFIDIRAVNSGINEDYNRTKPHGAPRLPATLKCWVFENNEPTKRR